MNQVEPIRRTEDIQKCIVCCDPVLKEIIYYLNLQYIQALSYQNC